MRHRKKEGKSKKKKIQKHKILFIGIVSFLVILFFITLLGLRISFLINDDLTIRLTPLDKSIITTYDKASNLTFEFENDNSVFCKSSCNYEFFDLSKDKTLDSNSFTLPSKSKVVRSYQIIPSNYGSGQDIYSFQVSCHNIKTILCTTDEKEHIKSSFITLSYDVSEEERIKIIDINLNLNSFLDKAKQIEKSLQEISQLFDRTYARTSHTILKPETFFIEDQIKIINNSFQGIVNTTTSMARFWDTNQYLLLSNLLNESTANIEKTLQITNATAQDLDLLINEYNSIASELETLLDNSSIIDDLTLYYGRNNNTELEIQASSFKANLTNLSLSFYTTYYTSQEFKEEIGLLWTQLNQFDISNLTLVKSSLSEQLNIVLPQTDTTVNLTFISVLPDEIKEKEPLCCVFGECRQCCTTESCRSDPKLYPIILVHGHALNKKTSPETSLESFAKIQKNLQEEGIINAGQIDLQNIESIPPGEYGRSGIPISVRASYYYIHYYDIGNYQIRTQKSERIENYALRLQEVISIVKERTGAQKVNIIAHSMGGLVTREYLRIFGDDNVYKAILIATPNYGVSGRTKDICNFLGSKRECEDMSEGSVFLKRLNQAKPPQKTKIYTIAGLGCPIEGEESDGLVKYESVPLPYAQNFNITGKCTDILKSNLHDEMLEPDKYPEVYEIVKDILKENNTFS